MKDVFRPRDPLMASIYDVFQETAKHRECHPYEWIERERQAVFKEAVRIAKENDLRVPTIDIIERYESNACGHVDYGKKWAMGIVEWMRGQR